MKPYIFITISLFLWTACEKNPDRGSTPTTHSTVTNPANEVVKFTREQQRNAGIEVSAPTIETLNSTLTLQGSIDVPPQSTISLSFPLGGYLKSTRMLPGMPVKKGQVLAEIEDMQFIQLQQDYLTAKEKLTLSVSEFERQRDLNANKASSDRMYQQARTDMETQRILVNALAQKLELIGIAPEKLTAMSIHKSVPIVSPIDGFVSEVNVNVGKYTAPTDMLFELVDPRDIHLSLKVFEKDLNKLSIGQEVTAYTNADPNKLYTAKIILIEKSLDQDRMAEVHCHLDRHSATLVPGMFMNGKVSLTSNQAITVAEDAVVRWENKSYVFVEKDQEQFQMVEVQPGVIDKGKQQIEAPTVDSGKKIVTKNAYSLLMKIKNVEEEE